jgi:hypothetical protein
MTDEELLNKITALVTPPRNTAELDPIWLLIHEHRETGWKRHFTDSDTWRQQNAGILRELTASRFGRK